MSYDEYVSKGTIEPEELAKLLKNQPSDIKLIDATFVLPDAEKKPKADFATARIDNAVFFDIDDIADHNTDLPHMLPPANEFAKSVSALGISNGDFVVAYAQHGMVMGPARAWWMFKVFGHDNVVVLNGGLPAWKASGFDVNTNAPQPPAPASFVSSFRPELVFSMTEVKAASETGSHQIIDARPAARFNGTDAEPRAGLISGHIPQSKNLPCIALIDTNTGKLKPKNEISDLFSQAGFESTKPTLHSCGSGVTACMNALALYSLGHKNAIAVYDGSWSEWGSQK